jgi:hypothetical protein
MTDQHPITPPTELVEQWREKWSAACGPFAVYLATQAAQWGADQELEACCVEVAWLESSEVAKRMRERRRPKPPSLKEQALADLTAAERLYPADWSSIRRVLEALPND